MVSENHLSSSLQTTLAVGGALALVAGAVIHRHKDKLSSFLVENLTNEEINQDVDWQKLTIPAQVSKIKEKELALIQVYASEFFSSRKKKVRMI
jgi:hypothetical protein